MPSDDNHDLLPRRKQAIYRANHRGIKEMDIVLGAYATARVEAMEPEKLERFEALLALPDQDLLGWITGAHAAPAGTDTGLLREIAAFHYEGLGNRP